MENVDAIPEIDFFEGYDSIRARLIRESYVIEKLVEALRKKYGIKILKGKSNWRDVLWSKYWKDLAGQLEKWHFFDVFKVDKNGAGYLGLFAEGDATKKITQEIRVISRRLSINEDYFRVLVLYDNKTNKADGPETVFSSYKNNPIEAEGTYIRVDDIHTEKELNEAYSKAKLILLLRKDKKHKKQRKKVISRDDKLKTEVYLKVEKELIKLEIEKSDSSLNQGYGANRIGSAIERVVGNSIEEHLGDRKISDKKFTAVEQEFIRKFRGYYYDIVDRYNTPKLTDLPELLRLIGC